MSPAVLATLMLAGFVLLGIALYATTNRFGPVRGFLWQPAARFRAPGAAIALVMYAVAALHVLAGVVLMFALPDGVVWSVLLVTLAIAGFYVLLGASGTLAERREAVARRRARAD